MNIKKVLYGLIVAVLLFSAMPTVTQAVVHPLGANISSSGTVYTITTENRQTVRRPYTSAGAYLSYSFNNWENVDSASAEDLQLPVGSFIPPRDGSIICSDRGTDKGTCYLITNRKRAGFTSEAVFNQLGFSFQWAKAGDVSFMTSDSHLQSGTEIHRPGTLVNIDGTVYYVSADGLRGIESMESLRSWGYWQTDIITANSADRSYPRSGILYSRPLGEIAPNYAPPAVPNTSTLKITNSTMTDGVGGSDYSYRFTASGGDGPYTWETYYTTHPCCYVGIMPSTGVFSNSGTGLKPQVGNWEIGIKVTDSDGATAQKLFSWRVAASNLAISSSSMPDGNSGQDYSYKFKATGGTGTYTWETYYSTHPCCYVGITNTGVFSNSGSGLRPQVGNWEIGIKVTDSGGATTQKVFQWRVNASNLAVSNSSMPDGENGQDYSYQFTGTGGTGPYTWDIYYITHPCCHVGIMPSTGVFSNSGTGSTPQAGSWQVGVKITDSLGATAQKLFNWNVD